MSALSRFFARVQSANPAIAAPVFNLATERARSRFRSAMPGELGACAAARLYGLGR